MREPRESRLHLGLITFFIQLNTSQEQPPDSVQSTLRPFTEALQHLPLLSHFKDKKTEARRNCRVLKVGKWWSKQLSFSLREMVGRGLN